MTTNQAAKVIGCNIRTVRKLIARGKLKARRKPVPNGVGFYWEISPKSVRRYANDPTILQRGTPRGSKRS